MLSPPRRKDFPATASLSGARTLHAAFNELISRSRSSGVTTEPFGIAFVRFPTELAVQVASGRANALVSSVPSYNVGVMAHAADIQRRVLLHGQRVEESI